MTSFVASSFRKLPMLLGESKYYHSVFSKIQPHLGPTVSLNSPRNVKLLLGPSCIKNSQINLASSQDFDKTNQVCWKCGLQRKDIKNVFCEECNVVQNPSESKNYFKVFNLDEKFDIDHKALRDMYMKLQSALHPDKFSNKSEEEKAISTNYSSLVNKAYSSLQVPLKRAEHLLQLKGDSVSKEETSTDPKFLMEMMELNEEMENVTNPETLRQLNIKNKNELEKIAREIDQCFQENDLDRAKECIVRMKFYSSLGNRINNMLRERGIVD